MVVRVIYINNFHFKINGLLVCDNFLIRDGNNRLNNYVLYDLDERKSIKEFGGKYGLDNVILSNDKKRALGVSTKFISECDLESNKVTTLFRERENSGNIINCARYIPNDNERISFQMEKNIYILNRNDGSLQSVLSAEMGFCWIDDTKVAYLHNTKMYMHDFKSKETKLIANKGIKPEVSNNRNYLVYYEGFGGKKANLVLFNLNKWEIEKKFSIAGDTFCYKFSPDDKYIAYTHLKNSIMGSYMGRLSVIDISNEYSKEMINEFGSRHFEWVSK